MLYVFLSSPLDEAREKCHAMLDSLLKRREGASVFRLTAEEISERALHDLAGAQGLFISKHIVLLDRPLEAVESREAVISALAALELSENIFLLLEEEVDAKTLAALKKYAEKITAIASADQAESADFNRFALSDALGKRDRKALWVLYQRAKLHNISDEEIHGLLFWQVKSMLAAVTSKDANEAGLKPFIYSKAKKYAQNFSPKELRNLAEAFVKTYHEARRGAQDFDVALERLILTI